MFPFKCCVHHFGNNKQLKNTDEALFLSCLLLPKWRTQHSLGMDEPYECLKVFEDIAASPSLALISGIAQGIIATS